MANVRGDEFWDDEDERLNNILSPFVLRILLAGAQEGEEKLPPNMRALVSWDAFNEKAIQWLSKYQLTWVDGLNKTTRKQAVAAIDEWIRNGEKLPALEARLTPIFGPERAGRIATTEVTRIYAEGNNEAWKATGLVQGRRWNTGEDELVCPICGGLNWQVAPFGYPFIHPETRETYENPPAHPLCRCFCTPVLESDDDFEKMLLRNL
jgi:SPP1 gp7 family putative phage head morphogenesis protein